MIMFHVETWVLVGSSALLGARDAFWSGLDWTDSPPPSNDFQQLWIGRLPNSIDTPGQLFWRRTQYPFEILILTRIRPWRVSAA